MSTTPPEQPAAPAAPVATVPATIQLPRPTMPAELRTSEGRLTIALQVLLALNTFQVWTYMSPRYSAIAQALIAAGYAIARGLAKTGSAGAR